MPLILLLLVDGMHFLLHELLVQMVGLVLVYLSFCDDWSLLPSNIILLFFNTTILSFAKLILQPSSANSGIDSSGCFISLKQ
jgi:hypothetical protein